MKTIKHHHNKKVALNRGDNWRLNLVKGKLDASLNPTKLRLYRVKKGLSHSTIASELGISTNTYGSIERGQRPVSKERAESISKLFNRRKENFFKTHNDYPNKLIAIKA